MATSSKGPDVFPQRLRETREKREMSQGELGRTAGMPPSAISHFEAGARKPSFDNLRRLAGALTVTTDYLLGRTDEPMGAGGGDMLFRDLEGLDELSDEDLGLARDFMETLVRRKRERKGD